jgi:glycogen debranching enzyme
MFGEKEENGIGSKTLSQAETQHRKKRILNEGTPSITRSIDQAVVIKNGNLFFLTNPEGRIPLGGEHGFGLYFNDCRFLSGYEVTLAGSKLNMLGVNADSGFKAVFSMTNREITVADGEHIPFDEIGIKWERVVDGKAAVLYEEIEIHNFGFHFLDLSLSLNFEAGFEDIFAIRGLLPMLPGSKQAPVWQDGVLTFAYDGADGRERKLNVNFDPHPGKTKDGQAEFSIELKPRQSMRINLAFVVSENRVSENDQGAWKLPARRERAASRLEQDAKTWLSQNTAVSSSSLLYDRIIERSLRDLWMLHSQIDCFGYFAAGLPWYGTLFGRDTLITALQTLAFNPDFAVETLKVLAHYQGKGENEARDEQPGKILHELRVGELAQLGEIPHTPYYGTVDATPLFLILLAEHAAWTGELTLFHELKPNTEKALEWIDKYGDLDGDGYVEYETRQSRGLINKGWKDSGDSIVNMDGSLAEPPVALVEVQAYIYYAKIAMADLYDRAGDGATAQRLRKEAQDLRDRFNRDYWLEDQGFFALALQAGNRQAAVASSNAGHALWSGIAEQSKARQTAERLMEPDMFNYWGIRSLSSDALRYNPLGYHIGTVWPHDNSMIAAGFRRYGFDEAARKVFAGQLEAALSFSGYRLPELFCGFRRDDFNSPVHYPVACHPQAWAAATIPYMTAVFLGLQPEAFENRLKIIRPMLPDFVDNLQLRNMRIGRATVDIDFYRVNHHKVEVDVKRIDEKLEIAIEY